MPNVLILGAGSDMAVAMARKFAADGFGIQLAARNINRLKPLQSDLAIRYNSACSLHEFDAERPDTHAAFLIALPSLPDISISVFGYLGDQQKAESDWEECHRILQVNYRRRRLYPQPHRGKIHCRRSRHHRRHQLRRR